VSSDFPNLGVPPERAGYSTPWNGTVYNHFPRGEGYYTMTPLGSDEKAARFSFEHDRRGWVRAGANTQLGVRVIDGAERDEFLRTLTLTLEERDKPQLWGDGPIRVYSFVAAHAFICIARCEAPEVTTDSEVRADPATGQRAFIVSATTNQPAPGLPVTVVAGGARREMVTDDDGRIVIPDDINGMFLLTYRIRRPPQPYSDRFAEHTASWTLTVPFQTTLNPHR
jgi:hypothetical protein